MFITTESGAALLTEVSGLQLLVEGPPPPLQTILPSYLYTQYSDDANLAAFVNSYNAITQGYLNWFNSTPFSVYTNPNVSGPLLDWVLNGIYGIARPVFSSLSTTYIAGLNSSAVNAVAVNGNQYFQSGTATVATDDYYKRVATWTLYVGDGRYFNTNLLRKKVARFLYGVDGTDVTLSQAQAVHVQGALIPPGAPVLAQSAGGTTGQYIAGTNSAPLNCTALNGNYQQTKIARTTYVTALGETTPSLPTSEVMSANFVLVVDSPPAESAATGWNAYAADVFWPLTKQNATPIAIGTNWTAPTTGMVAGSALPTTNSTLGNNAFTIVVPASLGAASYMFQQAFQQGILPFPFMLSATVVVQ